MEVDLEQEVLDGTLDLVLMEPKVLVVAVVVLIFHLLPILVLVDPEDLV